MNNSYQDISKDIDLKELEILKFNRITKDIFVNNFLPLLLQEDTSEFTKRWIEVSSSPFHKVVMTDNQDNPIFLIPPLAEVRLDTGNFDSKLPSALIEYGQTKDTYKNIAENKLGNELNKVKMEIGRTFETVTGWQELVIYCGAGDQLKSVSVIEKVEKPVTWLDVD